MLNKNVFFVDRKFILYFVKKNMKFKFQSYLYKYTKN